MKNKIDNDNIEDEYLYGDDREEEPKIIKPFDPKAVDIISQTFTVATIVERLMHQMIVLDPNFQRRPGLWTDAQQSRLIESMIIKIPLPSFYFDADENDSLVVVDGLQRLYAIQRFMALDQQDKQRLRLTSLEYLTEYNGKTFEELPLPIQFRIRETNLIAFVIRQGTPEEVRNSIFTRINTGGVQLTPAEIKNSVYRGQAADLLKNLAHSQAFIQATAGKVKPDRMLDCEFVNRFLAFYILGLQEYHENLEEYLNAVLLKIKNTKSIDSLKQYENDFTSSMHLSWKIFGDKAFRKLIRRKKKKTNIQEKSEIYGQINKPLFECISVSFARLSENDRQKLLDRRKIFWDKYHCLLMNEDFVSAITSATAKKENVEKRYRMINEIIEETLHDSISSN